MADTNDTGKKVLSLAPRGAAPKTDAKGGDAMVRQSFSHGRSKTVAVEVKKKRTPVEGSRGGTSRNGKPLQLTEQEREARLRVLQAARNDAAKPAAPSQPSIADLNRPVAPPAPVAAAVAAPAAAATTPNNVVAAPKVMDKESLRRAEMEEMRRIKEQERLNATQAELKRQQDENAKRRAAQAAANGRNEQTDTRNTGSTGTGAGGMRNTGNNAPAPTSTVADAANRFGARLGVNIGGDEEGRGGKGGKKAPARTLGRGRAAGAGTNAGGRVNVNAALSDDDNVRRRSLASIRRRAERNRMMASQNDQKEKQIRDVVVPETITVGELANRMAERGADVVKCLMKMGMLVTITQSIDADTAELVVGEFGHRLKRVAETDVLEGLAGAVDSDAELIVRPPVVTIMGHVDHGKTSLLDAIRKANVASGEAGGITQHIGAYQVQMKDGEKITFIDTPGHAAFSEMRARGANVTDIVVLVVAADDGIMPQTIEAIRHAKAAGVPIVVAINKCDLPGADPQRVRNDLLQHDLVVEEMGGDVLNVEVSAKKKINLDKLLETILLQAEVLQLRANPNRTAQGAVVESKMETGRGSVATVLVQNGTLKQGDIFVAGAEWGRVRVLLNDRGETITEATPAMPVAVLGLQGTPSAGDEFVVVETEARAREVAEYRARKRREQQAAAGARGTLDQMFAQIKAGEVKELAIVIKGDVHGSVEALASAFEKLTGEGSEVRARVLHSAVGPITESDIILANASKAFLIGFNVRANPQAREMAKRDGVDINYYSIIYEAIDDVRTALTGMLKPTLREKFIGHAQIREVFDITKVGKIAGCMITDGMVKRGAGVRLLREDVVIHTGTLKTLKRFKDEVKEVKEGYECGMAFENYEDIKVGDIIEAYEIEEIKRELTI